MKATLRRNGELMFNMRITFAVGRDLMAAAVVDGYEERWTRGKVFKAVKSYVSYHGDLSCGAFDEVDEDDKDQAYETVDRLFPELIPRPGAQS